MTADPAAILRELHRDDPGNSFDDPALGPLFDAPFVGFADAADPWFDRFKEVIGSFHWAPQEALALAAPEATARTVICWCRPAPEVARAANRRERRMPAREWAYVRTFGEEVNNRMRHGLVGRLRALGFAAVAPAVSSDNERRDDPRVGLTTCWSERHTAFVAGLGTFGISGGLITRRGIAPRLGSVVTDLQLAPTPRPYGDDPFAWCLRMAEGSCGVCLDRCPTTSIGETVHDRDKQACATYQGQHVAPYAKRAFGWEGIYGCGLCQTDVPCEDRNPTAAE